jgi:quinoprotein glucose dehydrogenase
MPDGTTRLVEHPRTMSARSGTAALFFWFATLAAFSQSSTMTADWPSYGGDAGGQRHTAAIQIARDNVTRLAPAWTFHTGSMTDNRPGTERSSFEATPILFQGLLYISSPFDEIFALDPRTGEKRWGFDPKIRDTEHGVLTSRGVASWSAGPDGANGLCQSRIFIATMDSRLIALDARSGSVCTGFGQGGNIDLSRDVHFLPDTLFYNTSPPTVVGNVVIVGSSIGDNTRVDPESGVVRAYDCVTGRLVWNWDPIPWANRQTLRTGAANAWSVMATDTERGIVYIPTGSASPDFYGGMRPGDNRDANSVVALDAATGKRLWGFQVVHHDLWDYDVAAQPLLFTYRDKIPAIAITTKQGLIFVLNRLTGEPLYPVVERPVPASDVPGESASPTQPFQEIDTLAPIAIPPGARLGATSQDDRECRQLFAGLRYDGIYTPPSFRGTLAFPGNLGGVNWGSAAFDPATGILYANTNRYAFSLRLFPRPSAFQRTFTRWTQPAPLTIASFLLLAGFVFGSMIYNRTFFAGPLVTTLAIALLPLGFLGYWINQHFFPRSQLVEHFGREEGEQTGTPYTVLRERLIAPTSKHPCTVLPWGAVSAVNLNTGKAVWQTPLGTALPGQQTGTINLGGDIVTASGLLFTAASQEPFLRAFDSATGHELWKGSIPAPAQSTPMSYTIDGRQYIVIAAGGHGLFGTPLSDSLVAFALPQ